MVVGMSECEIRDTVACVRLENEIADIQPAYFAHREGPSHASTDIIPISGWDARSGRRKHRDLPESANMG